MANNRMWLIHKPTKLGVMIGKRMLGGWYGAPEQAELQRFFSYLEYADEGRQDDFILAMEDCTDSSCFDNWKYTDETTNGFRKFIFTG